ncbi:MAG: carboxypeptidase-like regulatory domain-containing protein, partial [Planctomycetota bacterium]
ERGGTIRVRVENEAGEPIPEAWVWLKAEAWRGVEVLHHQSGNDTIRLPIPRRADANGVYVWDWAPEGGVKFGIGVEGYAGRLMTLTAGDDRVVTLRRERKATGAIVDAATGEPVRDCTIVRLREGYNGMGQGPLIVNRLYPLRVDGEFSISLDKPDPVPALRFEALGYRVKDVGPWEDGAPTDALRVELEPAAPLRGRVVDAAGDALAGVNVFLASASVALGSIDPDRPALLMNQHQVTDDEGRYAFPAMPEAVSLVVATDEGYAETSVGFDEQPEALRLRPWARIEGRLVRDGRPVVGQPVGATPLPDVSEPIGLRHGVSGKTGDDGRFTLERVRPGFTQISAGISWLSDTPLRSGPSLPREIDPGEVLRIDWGDAPGAVVGRVVLPEGLPEVVEVKRCFAWLVPTAATPLPGAPDSDKLLPHSSLRHDRIVVGEDGAFEARAIEPGDYTLRLSIMGPPTWGAVAEREVEVTVPEGVVDLGEVLLAAVPPSE